MNIEELKLILETISGLGAGAKEMFIWWLVFDKAVPAALWLIGIVSFVCGFAAVIRVINGESAATALVKKYRGHFGLGRGYLSDSEVRDVEKRIDELLHGGGK